MTYNVFGGTLYSSFTRHLKTFYFNTAFNDWLLLGHLATARAIDSMFLCIDFVRITNCFYVYLPLTVGEHCLKILIKVLSYFVKIFSVTKCQQPVPL